MGRDHRMIELLGRHRNRRPARWGVCVAAAALLGTVPFAGPALADDESEEIGRASCRERVCNDV